MKIKVYVKTPGCLPHVIDKGDWIDLTLAETVTLKAPYIKKLKKYNQDDHTERIREVTFDYAQAHLGVCIEVPKGYECVVVPRSSTFKKYGILQTNSVGVIDQTYCSNEDEWQMPITAVRNVTIPRGTRIAQFKVQLSQKATLWQKLKWLFNSGVKIENVEGFQLKNNVREGFGSTGN